MGKGVTGNRDVLKDVLGEPSLLHHALDGLRAPEHVRGVLQQHRVARTQRRRGLPEHLVCFSFKFMFLCILAIYKNQESKG